MMFDWICPACYTQYTYHGVQNEKATSKCSNQSCERYKLSTKIWQYQKKEIKRVDYTTITPITPTYTPMIDMLIIMSNYAINTIKNKTDVKQQRDGTTYYYYYKEWCRIRDYFKKLKGAKNGN